MKVLIVDDEQEIREGLCHILCSLPVEEIRIEVVGTAPDAAAALEWLQESEADVIITDIRMPGLDGLGLSEAIRCRYPGTRIIVLSGHGDFTYMQQALRLGTMDYLLKPVDETELTEALKRVAQHSNHKLQRNRAMTRAAFEDLEHSYKLVLAADIDDMQNPRVTELGGGQTVSWLMMKIFGEIADELGHLCYLSDALRPGSPVLVIGVFADSQAAGEEIARSFSEQFTAFWLEGMKLPASVGISASFSGLSSEASPYNQAFMALFGRLYHGTGIYRHEETQGQTGSKRAGDELHLVRVALETANEASLASETAQRLDVWLERADLGQLVRGLETLFLMIYERLEACQSSIPAFRAQRTADLISELIQARNAAELRSRVLQQVQQMAQELSGGELEGHVLVAAKLYIRSHLTASLTLSEVAGAIYVSPHHLSHLFRERTGMTFLEYVTALRMEEANRMLKEPGAKIYEVAEQIGYKSWKHFSRVFKEFAGIGPAEYRKNSR
ncbi:response regulator [Paenibacillus sp. FSL K6-1096]|uniref:response regulator n=1 Tax=Paenibacillus sp. FSL K6-1096 TaxID=2921460 RepID=UPI0030EDBB9C